MSEKRLRLSDIFDIDIVLDDGKFWYELEFDDYVFDGVSDFPIKAILRKGKRITIKEALYD